MLYLGPTIYDILEPLEICRKYSVSVDPGSEPELLFLSRNREKILEENIPADKPEQVIETCMNKKQDLRIFRKE
jgi:mevalonate pyrophosphate decarboxylase